MSHIPHPTSWKTKMAATANPPITIYDLGIGDKIKYTYDNGKGTAVAEVIALDTSNKGQIAYVFNSLNALILVRMGDIIEIVEKHNKGNTKSEPKGCLCDIMVLMARGCPSTSGGKCNSI